MFVRLTLSPQMYSPLAKLPTWLRRLIRSVSLAALLLLGLVTTAYAQTADYGDAPSSYDPGTPASHTVVAGVKLGVAVDSEVAAQRNVTAAGDDSAGVPDDEDGVTGFPPLTIGATGYSVTAACTGAGATVAGWVDFDANSIFDTGER